MLENSIKEFQREVLIFEFKDSILESVTNEIETHRMKVLKNYIEE